jgi:tetratricopeptide (TPR) repeat protein
MLRAQGKTREAVEILKPAVASHPDAIDLCLLLAQVYLDEKNQAWALRTLAGYLVQRPADCQASAWLGWLQMRQGLVAEARESLEEAKCEAGTPHATRRDLLLAMVAKHLGEPDLAAGHFSSARQAPLAFAEDRRALADLAGQEPGFVVPLTGRFEMSTGWAANALAGSPVDPATNSGDLSSMAGQLSAWLRFVVPTGVGLKPSIEVEGRSLGYTSAPGKDFSYLTLGARPGLIVGRRANLLLAYHFEGTLLAGGDRYDEGPNWFYNAHRAETEIGLFRSLSAFAGVGKRSFRESGRSRFELDGGVGGGTTLGKGSTQVLGAVILRRHDAEKDPYDLWGGSLLLSAEHRLPKQWSVRLGVLLGLDDYSRSAGYFDALAPNTSRRDVLLRVSASGFAPPIASGLRAGLTYEYAERFSTAGPYDYRDHRLLAKLLWTFSHDPWLPRAISPRHHLPLDYGFAQPEFSERIQDLLRQDEAAQRSSSCVK